MEAWQRDWDELLAGVTHSGPPVSSQLSPRHTWKDRGRPPFWELTDGDRNTPFTFLQHTHFSAKRFLHFVSKKYLFNQVEIYVLTKK